MKTNNINNNLMASSDTASTTLQYALIMAVFEWLQHEQEKPLPTAPAEPVFTEKERLAVKLGFTGVKEYSSYQRKKHYAEFENIIYKDSLSRTRKTRDFCKRLVEIRKDYMKDALLIPKDIFNNFCLMCGLQCSPFSSYTGSIPVWALRDINSYKDKKPSYLKENFYAGNVILEDKPHRHVLFGDWDTKTSDREISMPSCYYYIAAPKEQIAEIKDPLICARCDEGVIVLTRWGEEADNQTLRAYELLNNIISSYTNSLPTQDSMEETVTKELPKPVKVEGTIAKDIQFLFVFATVLLSIILYAIIKIY